MEKQIVLFIIDGFGIGESSDAGLFGDSGANTCGNLLSAIPTLACPTLEKLGLFNPLKRMTLTPGTFHKDTPSGIHELLGVLLPKWDVFPDGLPGKLLKRLEALIGSPVLDGKRASGTSIIQQLGPNHLATGYPIVYTSADSVFQIATHEEIIPLSSLYYYCEQARMLVNKKPLLGRVIARPFVGNSSLGFTRTAFRKDFPFAGKKIPLFEALCKNQFSLFGNRIIQDLFPRYPIQAIPGLHTKDTLSNLISIFQNRHENHAQPSALWIIDLEDFDMLYGHRRDVSGYGRALEEFDILLSRFLPLLNQGDICLITADHGNDPTYLAHTDHTRENVPLLVYPSLPEPGKTVRMSYVASYLLQWLALAI